MLDSGTVRYHCKPIITYCTVLHKELWGLEVGPVGYSHKCTHFRTSENGYMCQDSHKNCFKLYKSIPKCNRVTFSLCRDEKWADWPSGQSHKQYSGFAFNFRNFQFFATSEEDLNQHCMYLLMGIFLLKLLEILAFVCLNSFLYWCMYDIIEINPFVNQLASENGYRCPKMGTYTYT